LAKQRSSGIELVVDQGTKMILYYRQHPCQAAYDLLGVDLAPIQRLVFRDMWFKNYVIGVCSRGMGKTFLLGTLATLSCMLYPGYRTGLIGPVFRQSVVKSDTYTYDTFWTNSGLKTTTGEFYDSIQPGVTKIQSLECQNVILSKWENDERSCRYIKTTKGFELAGTTDHAIIILNNNFDIEFKDLQDLRYDDYIAIKTGFNYFGDNNSMPMFDEFEHDWRTKDCITPTELTTDLAYWVGLLVGDGCVSISKNKRKQRVDFVNEDQDLLDSFENYLREYFLLDKDENIDRRNRKNNTWEIQYFCKKLVGYLLKCGFTKTTALDKKIPDVIKKASKEVFIAFLRGLFDTDGSVYIQETTNGCEVSLSTSSLQLAREVHAVLLNLGIVSNLGISKKAGVRQLKCGNKPSKCAEAYKVRITGQEFLTKFDNIIGFRCKRKDAKFTDYLHTHFNREESLGRVLGLPQKMVDDNYSKCINYLEQGLYFVKLKEDRYFFAPTIDAEIENESCYWANGFINHNSKMIFSEVEKLYSESSIFREACEKRPIRGTDTCYVKFKSVAGIPPAFIEALPLGDGSKIRGSRFYLVCLDELAQIPNHVLDMVVRPMGATTLNPMANVRRLEKQQRLIELGLADKDDFDDTAVNKMVMTSSGYYKFNHMWKRMKDHWSIMDRDGDASQYAVWQVPHWDLPKGFLDKNNIAEAKRIMSDAEFKIEYEAEMISDSEGFFKASLLESCTDGSNYSIELKGKVADQYVIGVDPNQGGNASCGVVIVKIGTIKHVVNVMELKRLPTQTLTEVLQKVCDDYNVIRIFMDSRGGGNALRDLLEEGYGGVEPIIDITNPEHKHVEGRHILDMVDFNPKWISNANFTTKALLENKKLLFPEPPQTISDIEGRLYDNINKLKSQMLSIVVTQTGAGNLHFDTPKKNQNKDIYSAMILAAYGAREMEKEFEEDVTILHNSSGLIRERRPGATFNEITKEGPAYGKSGISFAVLKGKRRIK
jgi:intein-encoded DNA endonuclease-like protein